MNFKKNIAQSRNQKHFREDLCNHRAHSAQRSRKGRKECLN
ncbi:hypothetical protein Cabys_1073 [Caldithrix abyssi DSM 13497]|uniref:Uncharacterized protein n=1 Tax=Caldithrix abyssi DSM 13497 TaxID=880073 RepID=A0A1J1C5I1_CALAY|nr:hypothetical protein Cabys_1073 [Caldithrix abyssi DSM 13497]